MFIVDGSRNALLSADSHRQGLMVLAKLEYTRFGPPTTSILSKRVRISFRTIFDRSGSRWDELQPVARAGASESLAHPAMRQGRLFSASLPRDKLVGKA
jgi:hypothetical protein